MNMLTVSHTTFTIPNDAIFDVDRIPIFMIERTPAGLTKFGILASDRRGEHHFTLDCTQATHDDFVRRFMNKLRGTSL